MLYMVRDASGVYCSLEIGKAMQSAGEPPLSEGEIETEIDAARTERRAKRGASGKGGPPVNTRDPHTLIEKLKHLPPERVAEVEDFVDFLRTRDGERALERATARAAEPAFAKVWENDADAAYDQL